MALQFSKNELDAIAATAGNTTPIACFTDLLSRWLKRAPPNHDLPTLETLAKVLRGGTVGEERMAYELMQNFQGKMRHILALLFPIKFSTHSKPTGTLSDAVTPLSQATAPVSGRFSQL